MALSHYLLAGLGIGFGALLTTGTLHAKPSPAMSEKHPNIVVILADDLGYGDVSCLNPDHGKIRTPNLDRLASQGVVFSNAHSNSAVCTPSRYGLLTGRYSWRTPLQMAALMGYNVPLISENRLTVGKMLQDSGYSTACIGKWHLGLGWQSRNSSMAEMPAPPGEIPSDEVDCSKPILHGPTTRGFDYFYGITASLDIPPFIYIENDRTVGEPSVQRTVYIRTGPAHPDFEPEDVLPTFTRKSVEYIQKNSVDAKKGKPFFLYLAINSPHTPLVPTKAWKGKSGLGDYGDYVMETDWAVGEVVKSLDKYGLTKNTLVLVTSDNGCAPYIGVADLEAKGHYPSADSRGYKGDSWDGGHRVPFLVRWPGVVKPNSTCGQLVSMTDIMATCAEIVGKKLPSDAGEDSTSILPLLKDRNQPVHEAIVHHSLFGCFAIRDSQWKLVLGSGSGGWAEPNDLAASEQGLPRVQLYDMKADPGETTNLQDKHPEVVERLLKLLEKYVTEGRSTTGKSQKNDFPVDIWKTPRCDVIVHPAK